MMDGLDLFASQITNSSDSNSLNKGAKASLFNKIDSFYSDDVQSKRLTQKQKVYLALKKLKRASHRELSEYCGIERHLIPDRVLSLIEEGKAKEDGFIQDNLTKKRVTAYVAR